MVTRRAVLSLATGVSLALAGCDGPRETTEQKFGLTTTGADGVPGQAVGIDVMARGVGVVTYRINALPPNWQVTQGHFDPQPSSIRETYPPELVWEPSIGTVTGTFIVAIPAHAEVREYSLPVEARAGGFDETTVSTAIITVEGPTSRDTPERADRTGTPRETGSPTTPQRTGAGPTETADPTTRRDTG